jgi:CubicO group peptidase (beta-lactamase class C family)
MLHIASRRSALLAASASLSIACATSPAPTPAPLPMRYAEAATARPAPDRKARLAALVPKLDALFAADVAEHHYPGLGVGMVLDGEVVYAKGFGYRDADAKAPFETDSAFRIASVTKGFAVMAILKLRDQGKLQLDEPAARYYPALSKVAYPTRDSAPMTVRQLLSHSSGLPEDNYFVDAANDVSDAKLVAMFESALAFSRAPNTSFEYSNTGYAIVGKIIEHVSGMPARDYIRREMLLPLGMTSSVFSREEVPKDKLALGYRAESGYHSMDSKSQVAPIQPAGVYDTAGGMFSTIGDMSKYLAYHLAAWPPRDGAEAGPLRRSSVREMHVASRIGENAYFPQLLLPGRKPFLFGIRRGAPSIRTFGYGLGFFIHLSCEDDFEIEHGGGLPGYSTSLVFYPKRGFGIVLFINDERVQSDPERDATKLLREAGVIDLLEAAPVPALDRAKAEVESLLAHWDPARAEALFEPSYWIYQPRETLAKQLAELSSAHGACHAEGGVHVNNGTRGSVRMVCDRGEITFAIVLSPASSARLQALIWEEMLPPSEPMLAAARNVIPWIEHWDEAAAKTALAPDMDMRATRKALGRAALDHGVCRLEKTLSSDGKSRARFLLSCTESDVEMSIRFDPKTERITQIDMAEPRTTPHCSM